MREKLREREGDNRGREREIFVAVFTRGGGRERENAFTLRYDFPHYRHFVMSIERQGKLTSQNMFLLNERERERER